MSIVKPGFIAVMLIMLGYQTMAEAGELVVRNYNEGGLGREAGLEAWHRIDDVLSHPRCVNCHVGEDNIPLWQAAGDASARAHGMNIDAGESRIGAEYLPCATCHQTSTLPNNKPHAPPHVGLDWRLAPPESAWIGKTSAEICAQLRDPDRNGGRNGPGLIKHITHDAEVGGFIAWGFAPGAGRDPAPYTLQAHLDDTIDWVEAGMPCEND